MAKKRSKQNPLLLVGIGLAAGYVLFNKKAAPPTTDNNSGVIYLPTPKGGQKIIELRGLPRGFTRRPMYL